VDISSLDRINSWVVFVILFVLLIIATQIGFMIGARSHRRTGEDGGPAATTIQAAVLGLLALLLGFSFSMAMSRYDIRKRLVVEEANDIGTTYLRAKMLPGTESAEACSLLRRYVDNRLKYYDYGVDYEAIRRSLSETDRLQKQLWSQAMAAVRADPNPVPTGLFVQSLNNVIDGHAKRIEAFENQVPEAIFLGIYIVAILSMALTGRVCGLSDNRNLMPTITAALLISLVVFMINDLDRPRQGTIKVSQQSMINLRESMDGWMRHL